MGTKVTKVQESRAQEIDRLCLGGFCSKDLISSYRFGRRVVELKQEVIDLKNERGDIVDIAEMVPEDPAVELPVERTVVGQELNQFLTTFGDASLRKKTMWELLAYMVEGALVKLPC